MSIGTKTEQEDDLNNKFDKEVWEALSPKNSRFYDISLFFYTINKSNNSRPQKPLCTIEEYGTPHRPESDEEVVEEIDRIGRKLEQSYFDRMRALSKIKEV